MGQFKSAASHNHQARSASATLSKPKTMSTYRLKLTALLLVALLGAASASEWKKPSKKYHKKKYHTTTHTSGAGGARASSSKKPGKAYASSLDIGTAFSTPHFQGENTVDVSDASAMVEYASAVSGGSTKASTTNEMGYTEGKSGTMSKASEAGATYPDIGADASADGYFEADGKGEMTFSQGGQDSYATVDENGYASASADAGTRSYETKKGAFRTGIRGALATELATAQGTGRLVTGRFFPFFPNDGFRPYVGMT